MYVELIAYLDVIDNKSRGFLGFRKRIVVRHRYSKTFSFNPFRVLPLIDLSKISQVNLLADGQSSEPIWVHVEKVRLLGKDRDKDRVQIECCGKIHYNYWQRTIERLTQEGFTESRVIREIKPYEPLPASA